ncbi:putative ferric-chelate reductase 1 [Saccostrea echinata]|uniref:putative ferric-chelate reductase 1 n=1 Tax=Saccostrea echinata TaxID=191078 RepID=UPI002A8055EA|nr:putative ferric-chelate reductase 1 [Saccostrea echinata]
MFVNVLLCVLSTSVLWQCQAYPTGSPGCKQDEAPKKDYDFVPFHSGPVNDENLPYYVSSTKSGKEWTVRIWAENSYFKGFLLRVMALNPSETVTGSYVTMPSDTRSCSDTDATHSRADTNRTSLTFVWKQSDEMSGDVYFKATIVHSKTTDYKITTSLPKSSIVRDPECGSSKGCQSDCHSGTCSYQVTWQKTANLMRFEFQQDFGAGNKYQALGLSSDQKMGNDSVMVCKAYGGKVEFEQGYNIPQMFKFRPVTNPNNTGINVIETSQVDNVIQCVIERPINSTNPEVFTLSQPWYVLHSMGSVLGGNISYHYTTKSASSNVVNFLSVGAVQTTVVSSTTTSHAATTTTQTTTSTSNISPDPECGTTKGCLESCSGTRCTYMITWQKRNDLVRFEMMQMSPGNQYQAIGLSSDAKMGGDSVMTCKVDRGMVSFELGYTTGTSYSALPSLVGSGVSIIETSQTAGRVRCVVERTLSSINPKVFSLTQKWYLLRSTGPLASGAVTKHSTRSASSSPVDFLSTSLITEEQPDNLLVKIHGSFMMIAWVMFSSIGIVTARFFKNGWEGKTLMGQKVWFQIHRTCMVLVFTFTVSAFVVIFVDVGGYREVVVEEGKGYLRYHPILGIIVTTLTVINPIMSLFRCAPTDSRRPIFYIAHFTVGTVAHILAAITVLFGMNIDRSNLPAEASYIMYAYIAVFVMIEITLELLKLCQTQTDTSSHVAIEMKYIADKDEKSIKFEERPVIRKEIFLYFHILLMVGFCSSLVVLLIMS